MSRFFIDRPIFAWVIAIVIMLAGALSITTLSISQYPQIAPTTVRITATYTGADASTVENSVTKVIEQGMTGIDNLDYMTSTSTSTGQTSISLTFTNAANPDTAQVQVQNKLALVQAQLPSSVVSTGITVSKSTANFLMVVGFVSMDDKLNANDLADYVDSTLAQNVQVSAGQLGALPAVQGPAAQRHRHGAVAAADAGAVPRHHPEEPRRRRLVRINDVARVELGAKSYTVVSRTTAIPPRVWPSSWRRRQRAHRRSVKATATATDQQSEAFPPGMSKLVYPIDTRPSSSCRSRTWSRP
jgi:multidrug efflux pump